MQLQVHESRTLSRLLCHLRALWCQRGPHWRGGAGNNPRFQLELSRDRRSTLLSTFFSGFLVQDIGAKKTLVGGLILQGLGLLFIGQDTGVWPNLLAIILIGLGEGGNEVATNFCLLQLEKSGRSQLMNSVHATFTAGAILGPPGVGFLLEHNLPWQNAFQVLGLLSLGMAYLFQRLSFTDLQITSGPVSIYQSLKLLQRDGLLLTLTLIIFLYVGAEIGISNWIAEYFIQTRGATPAQGAYMVSVFWLGLLAGRLLVAYGYRGRRQLSGIGFAAVYPVTLVMAGQYFAKDQGLAIGAIATGGGIGAFLFPFAMSGLAANTGIGQAFWFYVAISLAMTLMAGLALRKDPRTDAES